MQRKLRTRWWIDEVNALIQLAAMSCVRCEIFSTFSSIFILPRMSAINQNVSQSRWNKLRRKYFKSRREDIGKHIFEVGETLINCSPNVSYTRLFPASSFSPQTTRVTRHQNKHSLSSEKHLFILRDKDYLTHRFINKICNYNFGKISKNYSNDNWLRSWHSTLKLYERRSSWEFRFS